jgi:hypothetical protein
MFVSNSLAVRSLEVQQLDHWAGGSQDFDLDFEMANSWPKIPDTRAYCNNHKYIFEARDHQTQTVQTQTIQRQTLQMTEFTRQIRFSDLHCIQVQ